MTLNDHNHLDILYRTALTGDQRQRLLKRITQFFKEAIDARSPRNRPPGKAGLRAEKGYYRLLYLEGEFHQRVNSHDPETPDGKPYSWENMIDIVDRLGDLSELQSEMIATIESAVDEMVTTPNQGL